MIGNNQTGNEDFDRFLNNNLHEFYDVYDETLALLSLNKCVSLGESILII